MRLCLWLFLALTGGAPAGLAASIGDGNPAADAAPAASLPVYFPPAFARTEVSCEARSLKPIPILGEFEQGWYSAYLKAADEPSLFSESQKPRPPAGPETLRFTWLRSFDAPVIVRVERDGSGRLRLIAKRLSGVGGGFRPGTVEQKVERDLTDGETARLRNAFVRNRLFELPPRICDFGIDGGQWIFEAVTAEGYHFLDRWTPGKGPVREMGELLLGLTGWKPGGIY